MKEAKDSSSKSSAYQEGSRRFFPSGSHIYKSYTTPQQVLFYYTLVSFAFPSKSWKRQKIPPHAYLLLSKFSTTPNGSNDQHCSCIYPSGIENVGTVEKGRDRDRERVQGQPKARASPKKVKKEMKKTRGMSHLKKLEAGGSDGHHRDCILLLFFWVSI